MESASEVKINDGRFENALTTFGAALAASLTWTGNA